MNSVIVKPYLEWEKDVALLLADATRAAWQVGFLIAAVNNSDTDRVASGSKSGFALQIAHNAVLNSLSMFCSRAWDKRNDVISLKNCIEGMPSADGIWASYSLRSTFKKSPLGKTGLLELYSRLLPEYSEIRDDRIQDRFTALRNERDAHLSHESNVRKKTMLDSGIDVGDVVMNETLDMARKTIGLVNTLGILSGLGKEDLSDRIRKSERYCRTFWRVMPRLAEVEN